MPLFPRLPKNSFNTDNHKPSLHHNTVPDDKNEHSLGEKCAKDGRRQDASDRPSHVTYNVEPCNVNDRSRRNTVSSSCSQPKPGSKEGRNNATANNPDLRDELRKLSESKAELEAKVKERTELLRHLHERRADVAAEGERLRRSVSPEISKRKPFVNQSPRSSPFTSSDSSSPDDSTPATGLSAARIACLEAYARMTPIQRYLMREKLHWDGIKRRDPKKEVEERLLWERLQRSPSTSRPSYTQSPKTTSDTEPERILKMKKIEDETQGLLRTLEAKEKRQHLEAWGLYESSWNDIRLLQSTSNTHTTNLAFNRIPWPVLDVFIPIPATRVACDNAFDAPFSADTLSLFLFSMHHSDKKSKRQRLREALLRYHPDRFDSRVLCLVVEKERVAAKQAVRRIAGVLNSLLSTC